MADQISPNAEFIDCWNDILVPKFTRFRRVIVDGFTGHSDAVIEKYGPQIGDRVLDVGCGFGDTSIELAKRVAPSGEVLGIDCCEGFLDAGRKDASEGGIRNVRFECVDAQTHRFEREFFDVAFSRFGTMFFQSPKAAMKNICAALKSKGRLAMSVWRAIEYNDWLLIPKKIAQKHLPPPPERGQTCGPGPFSMADPETVKDILLSAGFSDVHIEAMDVPVMVGRTLDEAIDLQLQLGPTGELMREAGDVGEAKKPDIEAELRARLSEYNTDKGVVMSSSSWCVRAQRA